MDTARRAQWLPFFSVEGCFGAKKTGHDNFIALKQSKTGKRLVLDNASVHGSQCPCPGGIRSHGPQLLDGRRR
jgi:hypothetical protein